MRVIDEGKGRFLQENDMTRRGWYISRRTHHVNQLSRHSHLSCTIFILSPGTDHHQTVQEVCGIGSWQG